MPAVFLDQDLLVAKIADTRAAVAWIGPHQQVALLARIDEGVAVDKSLFAPAFAVRPDLRLKSGARNRETVRARIGRGGGAWRG